MRSLFSKGEHKGNSKLEFLEQVSRKDGRTYGRTAENKLKHPTIVILGPTGSGKTDVSIKIAKEIGGEIISADSRAIYKGMDIGTAKPSGEEQAGIPHFGLDLVEPGERFTVADWKKYTEEKIKEIHSRRNVPIIVGGTGLYVDALIYDYKFKGPTGEKIGDLEQKSCSDRKEVKGDFLIIGVKTERDMLRDRLKKRIDKMFDQPLYDEVKKLVQKYGWGSGAMKSNIYEYAWAFLEGKLTLDEAKEKSFYEDWHLVKRQLTWFKRNKNILWLELEKIYPFVIKYIQNEQRN
ncbi:MAG: tRNA (adenosine(37)-N6)-dimethylallyltransferase MiaA [Candidatus Saccharibacteria bacterium]|nr:tRNA (adenosine(37)-N6)-dimethylallyltransferase MiaA [Candidatus Saccharibacteria bacterium]